MILRDLLEVVTEALHTRHPVHGGRVAASTVDGEPRATQDIDIVIDPQPEQLAELLRSFDGETFYVGDCQAAQVQLRLGRAPALRASDASPIRSSWPRRRQ